MSSAYESIVVAKSDGIATLTLNRPQRANAMNRQMVEDLGLALDDLEADPGIRVIIVTGAGAAFTAGFDLKEQAERRPRGTEVWQDMLALYSGMILRFWRSPKPTIAAINGACMAGGFELALACDLSIASEAASFGEPELQFGAGIVAMLLPWFVSPKVAKRIILLGEDTLDSTEALHCGIVGQVVSPDKLMPAAMSAAKRLACMDPPPRRPHQEGDQRCLRDDGHGTGDCPCRGHRRNDRSGRYGGKARIPQSPSVGRHESGSGMAAVAVPVERQWPH